ncbi:MAG: HAD family hydrolase [Elusimicrobiota bacterium]|jgi:phosphoglycolate phosphatase-like HAD superfamily hydrolase
MKVLLFDIDGTLVRAGGAGRKALNKALHNLYGRRGAIRELSLAGRTDLWNFREAVRRSGRPVTRKEVDRLHREYLRLLPEYVRRACRAGEYEVPVGLRRLLARLRRRKDVLLGLGTGNLEKGARIKLEPSGFNPYFAFGGFGSDAMSRPALLRKAVHRAEKAAGIRVDGQEVFVIGDTPLDVAAGRKAGYRTLAVGTGFASWKDLEDSRPDHLAKDFRDTEQWLAWFKCNAPEAQ